LIKDNELRGRKKSIMMMCTYIELQCNYSPHDKCESAKMAYVKNKQIKEYRKTKPHNYEMN
jgi:hypothetical protein